MQFPFRGGCLGCDLDLLAQRRKTRHRDLNFPGAVLQVRKGVQTFLISNGAESLWSLGSRYGSSGNGQACKAHLPVVLGCERYDGDHPPND